MRLEEIFLVNFRNYERQFFSPGPRVNMITGLNGRGKTNLMEAIALVATGRSFRTNSIKDVIQFGKETSYLRGSFMIQDFDHTMEMEIEQKGRKLIRDHQEVQNMKDYRQNQMIVTFQPEDLLMVKSSPSLRRKYLDELLRGIYPLYDENIKQYQHVLNQRNYSLKRLKSERSLLNVYNIQLARLGSQILYERLKNIKLMSQWTATIYKQISREQEVLEISYLSTLPFYQDLKKMEGAYLEKLNENYAMDLKQGRTGLGPHLDDLQFKLNGRDAKTFASQGQQRSIVLALKLAEVKLVQYILGVNPIVLLDDVFSELDHQRREDLLKIMGPMQTFITMTEPIEELKNDESLWFHVENGEINTLS